MKVNRLINMKINNISTTNIRLKHPRSNSEFILPMAKCISRIINFKAVI